MQPTVDLPFVPPADTPALATRQTVVLSDGTSQGLDGLTRGDLLLLQWRQEREFAARILGAAKGSAERAEAVRHAYDTVTRIYIAARGDAGRPLTMGLQPRYERLVLRLLERQRRRGLPVRLFEIGYATGLLLKRAADAGFPVAGIEVSALVQQSARALLGPALAPHLHRGDFLRDELPPEDARASLVYWNDVAEHIPPDELSDYLRRIHAMLVPGGQLLSITPNWLMRPMDITRAFCPPRSAAVGLHLKEYTLTQMAALLHRAGFRRVSTPLFVTRRRIALCGRGLAWAKRAIEPLLERLPYAVAQLLCRGFGLSMTIADKG